MGFILGDLGGGAELCDTRFVYRHVYPTHPNNISVSKRITMKTKISGISGGDDMVSGGGKDIHRRCSTLNVRVCVSWEVDKVVWRIARWIRRMIYAEGVFYPSQSGIMFVGHIIKMVFTASWYLGCVREIK